MSEDDARRGQNTGDYTYSEAPDYTDRTMRPLPEIPVDSTGAPGQSRIRETVGMDRVVDGVSALQLGEGQGQNSESFFLRQLSHFKGEYDGEAIFSVRLHAVGKTRKR